MSGLMKAARGLPKFVMECGWWRHPAWVGASPQAFMVQVAAVSYCGEHETDGRLPGPGVEILATALGLEARQVKRGVEELLERGRWVVDDDGYEVVGYLEHNASSAEIRAHRERRSNAGRKASEARWSSEPEPLAPSGSEAAPPSETECESVTESDAPRSTTTDPRRNARAEQSNGKDLTPSAPQAPAKDATRRGRIFTAIVMALKIDTNALTASERRDVNKTAKELDDRGIDPDEIGGFPRWWRQAFPGATVTHRCLRGHWSEYAARGNGNGASEFKTRIVDGELERFMPGSGWMRVAS